MHLKRAGAVIGLTLVGYAVASPAVDALKWGTITSSYDGRVRVQGNGNHYNSGGSRAANTMTIKDRANDGNSVYGSTTFYYWLPDIHDIMRWTYINTKGTGEIENGTITRTVSVGLNAESDRSRAVSKACAQMGWPVPDSCGQAITTWEY
jgi:hypothetical protein